MAVNTHLKIDGIQGESKDKGHDGEIDVLGWAWGLSQTGTFGSGGGGGAGKVNVQDLSITKRVDKSTPELMLKCANGKHIDKCELKIAKAGENPLEYMKITMEHVLVSSISTGGGGGDEVLHENVSFNFSKYKVEYVEQDEKGKGKSPVITSWDIAKNEK